MNHLGNRCGSRHQRRQRRARTAYATQYLTKCKIESAEIGLTGRDVMIVIVFVRVAVVTTVTIVAIMAVVIVVRIQRVGSMLVPAVRMPGGMHQSALLSQQQQRNQYIVKIPARHDQ